MTPRQELFIQEYLKEPNATQAAIKAGYSEKTACKIGSENLQKPDIAAAIRQGLDRQVAVIEEVIEKQVMTKVEWLTEVARIATADMSDYADIVMDSLQFKDSSTWPKGLGRNIKKLSQTQFGISMELHNKSQAIELLGKSLGWVKESVVHSGSIGNAGMSKEQATKLLQDPEAAELYRKLGEKMLELQLKGETNGEDQKNS